MTSERQASDDAHAHKSPGINFAELPRGLPGTHARSEGAAPRALWMPPEVIQRETFFDYEPGKIFLGHLDNKYIGVADDRHLFTVAGSRAGKGRSAIIPNLFLYPGSTLTLDPKGENARLTARHRRDVLGHDVYVIDPFNTAEVDPELRASFNPFDELDPDDDSFIDECATLADALIMSASGEANNHWNNTARIILRGLIAYVAAEPLVEYRDLGMVMDLLHAAPTIEDGKLASGFKALLKRITHFPDLAHGVPANMANLLLSTGENEYGSLLSTVMQNLAFMASPKMRGHLSDAKREDAHGMARNPILSEWKFKPTSIYLCLPASLLHSHARFFRLFLVQLLRAVERKSDKPKIPALILLDEMHVLGHMAVLETAAGLFAGYGVKLWSFWQDMSQLKALYKDRWETFIGNSGVVQAFGVNDSMSLRYLSERLGKSSILSINQSEISIQQYLSSYSGESKSIQQAPLLTPEEIEYFFSRQSGNQLLMYPGVDPIFIQRSNYDDTSFQHMVA